MSILAVGLVLVSAACHATWNLLAKLAGSQGVSFVWLVAVAGTMLWAPAVAGVLLAGMAPVGSPQLLAFAVSAVLHTGYFVALQRGYGRGDLSLVYPVARGTGPLLASVGAIALLGERPPVAGFVGIALISGGVFVLGLPARASVRSGPELSSARVTGPGLSERLAAAVRPDLGYGLLTGVLIACYTVWDGYAVTRLNAHPVLLMWTTDLGRALLLMPFALQGRGRLRGAWRGFRGQVLGAAVLSPLAYILVLAALTLSPVTSVAPLREVSVLLGVLFGARLLAEGHATRRLAAAVAIALGAAAITLA